MTLHPLLNKNRATRGQTQETPSHEAEARGAADRVLARRPVGALSPRASAALPGDAGPGQPLPHSARARLEASFGADLGHIRVHTNPAAHRLASAQFARAFAAGPHLVFSKDAFDPVNRDGLHLLAHETAHAMQQSSDQIHGTAQAAVQRQIEGEDGASGDQAEERVDLWTSLKHRYENAITTSNQAFNPRDRGYQADVTAISEAIGDGVLERETPNEASGRVAASMLSVPPETFRGRCLLLDVFVRTHEFDAAVALLLDFPTIEQATYDTAFTHHLISIAEENDFFAPLMLNDGGSPAVRRVWRSVLRRMRGYLLNLGEDLPEQSTAMAAVLNAGRDTSPDTLLMNQMQAVAILRMSQMESEYLDGMRNVQLRAQIVEAISGSPDDLATSKHIDFLTRIFGVARALVPTQPAGPNADPAPPTSHLLDLLREDMGATAAVMLSRAERTFQAARWAVQSTARGNVPTFARPQDREFDLTSTRAVRAYLTVMANTLNPDTASSPLALQDRVAVGLPEQPAPDLTPVQRLEEHARRLPNGTDFMDRRDAYVAVLRDNRQALIDAYNASPIVPEPTGDVALGPASSLLFLLIWSDWLIDWLSGFDLPAQDGVATRRFQVAQSAGALAFVFDNRALRRATEDVYAAHEVGVSYAIIPNGYSEVTGANFEDITDEIGDIYVVGGPPQANGDPPTLPVNTSDLVNFYNAWILQNQVDALLVEVANRQIIAERRLEQDPWQEAEENQMTPDEARAAGIEMPEVRDINTLMEEARNTVDVPKKFKAEGGRIIKHPDDPASESEIQLRHHGQPALIGRAPASGVNTPIFEDHFLVRRDGLTDQVYFWAIPDLDPVLIRIYSIPELEGLVIQFKADFPYRGEAAFVRLLQFKLWAEQQDEDTQALFDQSVGGVFSADLAEQQQALIVAQQRLTRVNRMIALDNMRDFLSAIGNRLEGILLPQMFGEMLQSFSRVVQPIEDREVQVVTLLLEAAPEIHRMVSEQSPPHDPNYNAISYLLPPLTLAISYLQDQSVAGARTVDEIRRNEDMSVVRGKLGGLAPYAPLFTDLEGRYEQVRDIMKMLLLARATAQDTWTLYSDRSSGLHSELASMPIDPESPHASFVMSLWSPHDVSNASEGSWEWGEHAAEDSALDGAENVLPDEPPTRILGTREPIFYRILDIYEDFEFIPAFNAASTHSASLRRPGAGQSEDPLGGFSENTRLVRISVSHVRGQGDDMWFSPERVVTIRAQDTQLLTLLAAVVDSQSRSAQLQELASSIEALGSLALDLAEFIPGYGQAIMVGRLAFQIIDAIASGEFDDIKDALVDDPLEEMQQISGALMQGLDGVSLWGFLFDSVIGSGHASHIADALGDIAERADSRRRSDRVRSVQGRRREGRFGQLARALGNIGITLADSLFDARERLQTGVDSAIGRISSTPALAPHLSRIDQYAIWAQMIGDAAAMAIDMAEDLTGDDADPVAAARAARAQAQQGFDPEEMSAAIGDMLGAVGQLELPDEIVPTSLLIEVVLELIMRRANRKVRMVYEGLRLAGLDSLIADAINEHILSGSFADPNEYWRTEIRSKFDAPFRDGRDAFVSAMMDTLEGLFPAYDFAPPSLEPTSIEAPPGTIVDLDGDVAPASATPDPQQDPDPVTPETEGFNLQGDPRHPHPGPLPAADGHPLAHAKRNQLEAEFGHDFGHVRIHDDPGAHDFVTGTGAKALTSGSRIYLGPDVDPASSLGDHILRHEISHVLQQTGPRPFDLRSRKTTQPVEGAVGRGLQLDPFREQAADDMAEDSVGRSGLDDGPMPVRARGPKSIAPFGQSDMLRVLYKLGREATGESFAERVAGHGLGLGETNAREATADARRMIAGIVGQLGGAHWRMRIGEDDRHINHIRSDVRHVLETSRLGRDFNRMLGRAAVEVRERRRRPGSHYRLDGAAFANILTGYIFDKTGIRLDIDLELRDRTQVRDVQIKTVHMGRLLATRPSSLYNEVKGDHNRLVEDHGVTFQQARAYLRARFPLPHKWKRTGSLLQLDADDLEEIANVRAASGPSRLDAANLPTWADYSRTSGDGLGLRVSNHGVLSKSKNRRMTVEEPNRNDPTGQNTVTRTRQIDNTERESHHVPQFLLAQFYAGRSGKPGVSPYGLNGDFWTPGYMVGSTVQTERPDGPQEYDGIRTSRETVDFRKLITGTSDRGDGMPAVSLSRRAHRKGGLHLPGGPSPDSESQHDDQSSPSQGFYLASRHRDFLIQEVTRIRQMHPDPGANSPDQAIDLSDADAFRALVTRYRADPDRTQDLQDATLVAMRKTYRLVTSNMLNWLNLALGQHEEPYYQVVLAEKQPNRAEDVRDQYTIAGNWKQDVKTALRDKNRQLFGAWYVADAWSG